MLTGTVLAAQLVLSRLLAATISYYFAFVLISLAMLGLASGALAVHALVPRLAPVVIIRVNAVSALLAGLALHVGVLGTLSVYPAVRGNMQTGGLTDTVGPLSLIFLYLFPFFLLTGFCVSLVLVRSRERFGRVYAIDLACAALGCALGLALLSAGSPSEAALGNLVVLPAIAGALFSLDARQKRLAGAALAAGVMLLGAGKQLVVTPQVGSPAHVDYLDRRPVVAGWNSFSSVVVYPSGFFTWALSPRFNGPRPQMLNLVVDGIGGTQIVRFNGDPGSLLTYHYLDDDLTALGHHLVPPPGRQLIIGPGGGVDVLQAVRAGRQDLTLVEINPLVVSTVNDALAGFSGRPYQVPGAKLFVENGRTFVRRSTEAWDLITLTWVDIGGSATALAASENYLYTVEAYAEYLNHLAPNGAVAFMRALGASRPDAPMDTLRGIAVGVTALERIGVPDAARHLIIGAVESPFFGRRGMCYVLLKRSPFTPAEVQQARNFLDSKGFWALWLAGEDVATGTLPAKVAPVAQLVRSIVTTPPERRTALFRSAPIDIEPSTDDNPFYFVERSGPSRAAGEGVRVLLACLALLLALVLVFLLGPAALVLDRAEARSRPTRLFLLYCACLGTAFMLVEMELFHVFGLLLGNPTYALGTVLASLLVASGAGSLLAPRLAKSRHALLAAFTLLVAMLVCFLAAGPRLIDACITWPLSGRVAVSAALVGALGLAMGIPMTAGMTLVASRQALVSWGWTVNGAFSVVASVGALLLAIHFGIAVTFLFGVILYAAAAVVLLALRRGLEQDAGRT